LSVEPLNRRNHWINLLLAAALLTPWPRALRQYRPSQVIAAGVPKKEVFAKTVAVTTKLCDRVQIASRSTPAHHALQVVRAVRVGEAGQ